MRILVHLRRGEQDFYLKMVKYAYHDADIVTLADERGKAMIWTGDFIYVKGKTTLNNFFDAPTMEDIRIRCRYLRKLEIERAYSLINSLAYGFQKMFEEKKFDFVMGGLIDCYVQDVLNRIAIYNHVLYVSFVGHFFNGYARISTRGELNPIKRKVTDEEISEILQSLLNPAYKPNFELNKEKSMFDAVKIWGREIIKKYAFSLIKIIKQDPDNYHYNTVLDRYWRFSDIWEFNMDKFFFHIGDVEKMIDENTIYMPLHFTPEATVDYWCDDPMYAYQESIILELIENMPKNTMLLIKEHPAMYLRRDLEFYRKIQEHHNVKLIHPYDNSNLLLEMVENVAVFTGSVGVEALLRGKRVFTFSKNYYSQLHPNIHKIKSFNENIYEYPIVEYPNELFVKALLQGLFKARFYNNTNIMKSDLTRMAEVLKTYVNETIEFEGKVHEMV